MKNEQCGPADSLEFGLLEFGICLEFEFCYLGIHDRMQQTT